MAKKMYEETRIAAVAEKIRELTGLEKKYTTEEMPEGVEEVAVTGYLAGLSEHNDDIQKNREDIDKINDSKGVANGIATLDDKGLVPSAQLPPNDDIKKNREDIDKINDSKGVANGIATLDESGHVLSTQLPSDVDSVIEGYVSEERNKFYEDAEKTKEITAESGKIYLDMATLCTYRWGGTLFAEISESLALGETANTAYYGDKGKDAYDHSQITSDNPHGVTAEMVGALPLTGGNMSGAITIGQGNGKGIELGTNGRINATDSDDETRTIFGVGVNTYAETDECTIGHPVFHTAIRGSSERPTYSQNNQPAKQIAFLSDMPLIIPYAVSYGTDSIDGIIGDTDTLPLEAFTRTPNVGDIFFFIATTRKKDVVGVTAKVLGLQTDANGADWVEFSVENVTLFHGGKEIDNLKETVNGLAIPLHYNYIVTLSVAFENLFRKDGIEGNPYTNSFLVEHFSRTPEVGDIFALIFIDKNKNNVYSFCEITEPPVQNSDGLWFSPFKVVYAIMLHNTAEIESLKESVAGLKTEEWTFLVENEDGSTTPVTKKVCVKQ